LDPKALLKLIISGCSEAFIIVSSEPDRRKYGPTTKAHSLTCPDIDPEGIYAG
jgi:hypothetical protein